MDHELIELATHAENEVLHEMQHPAGQLEQALACMDEHGEGYGTALANADLAAQALGTHHDQRDYEHAFQAAYEACGLEQTVEHEGLSIPSLTNPYAAAAELTLVPGSLEPDGVQWSESRDHFAQSFENAYHAGIEKPFDERMAEHFAVDWGHAEHPIAPEAAATAPGEAPGGAFQSMSGFEAQTLYGDSDSAHDAPAVHHTVDDPSQSTSGLAHPGAFEDLSSTASHEGPGAPVSHADPGSSVSHADPGVAASQSDGGSSGSSSGSGGSAGSGASGSDGGASGGN